MLQRTRLINFRVTPEEYERLRQASSAHGVGSFSDFARDVLLDCTRRRPSPAFGAWRSPWSEFDERLAALEGRLEQVAAFIDHLSRRLQSAARPERRPPRPAALRPNHPNPEEEQQQ